MGGRGSASSFTVRASTNQRQQIQQQAVTNQPPDDSNTPVAVDGLTALSQLDDDQLATLFQQSKTVDMPNHLNDVPDMTQKFAFAAGLNEKPAVLDDAAFDQFLMDSGISHNDILSRSVDAITVNVSGIPFRYSANDLTDMMKYSKLNYIGGKHGGIAYGAGTYFAKNGGANTGYGSGATALAVLNPQTARVIDLTSLYSQAKTWSTVHPKFAAQVGNVSNRTASVYALAMGYNVITDSANNPDYHNIIDRKALTYRKSNL